MTRACSGYLPRQTGLLPPRRPAARAARAALPVALTVGLTLTACTSPAPASSWRRPLSALVLQPAEDPPGTIYLAKSSGPQTLGTILHGDQNAAQERALLQQAGFKGAYIALFAGLRLPAPVASAHIVVSSAAVFPSQNAATKALAVSNTVATPTQTPQPVPADGLGPHARGVRATLTAFPGEEFIYLWTEGNTVRVLIDAGGTGVVQQAAALDLAHAVARQHATGTAVAADAGSLVLQPTQAPAGTEPVPSRSGRISVTQFSPAHIDATRLTQLGFEGGYVIRYLSAGLAHPSTHTMSPSNARQSNYIASQAQQYVNDTAAQRAFAVFRTRENDLFASRGTPLATAGLAPDSFGYRYIDNRTTGSLTGYVFYWCRGPYVLALFDVATQSLVSEVEARELADMMNAHAGQ